MVSSILGPLLNIFISGKMYDLEMTYPAQSIFRPRGSNPDTYGDAVAGWARGDPPRTNCEVCGAISWALRPFLWPVILSCSVQGSRINCVRISLLEKILFLQVFKSQIWLRPVATTDHSHQAINRTVAAEPPLLPQAEVQPTPRSIPMFREQRLSLFWEPEEHCKT